MAKRKKGGDAIALPSHIELICSKRGTVKEFKTDHAERILALQTKMGSGSYKLFNEDLYNYDEGSRTIKQNIRQSEPSEGDTIIGEGGGE